MGILYLILWMAIGVLSIAWGLWPLVALFGLITLIGYGLALRGGTPFTDGPVYIASRLAGSNLLLPTQVTITPDRVVRYKKRLIGSDQESISIAQIASVKIRTSLLWSDVVIESTGGSQPVIAHGHWNRDAIAMKATIEQAQHALFTQTRGPAMTPPPTDPATPPDPTSPTLHLALYPGNASQNAQPLTRISYRITQDPQDAKFVQTLLALLRQGSPGSHIEVEVSPNDTLNS